jgi:hypothetical protein
MIPRFLTSLLLLGLLVLTGCTEAPATGPEADRGALAPASAVASKSGQNVTKFSANEDHASLQLFQIQGDTEMWAYLGVYRGGSGPQAETYLFYYLDECESDPEDPWSWECRELEAGWGRIPGSAFQGRARSQIRLSVDTRTLPDFNHYAGEGLNLDLTWTATRDFEYSHSGSGRTRWGTWGYQWSGSQSGSSAHVEGRFGSMELPSPGWVGAGVGTSSGMNLLFERRGR